MKLHTVPITMWDFSWIERQWSGAGFEDWDLALRELTERGYEAVRIDAFPHLLAEDPERVWTLLPVWYSNDWGSPYINQVKLYPALVKFIRKCQEYGVKVGLSSWYREDQDNIRMKIKTPEKMAENWIAVLKLLQQEGVLDQVLYLDLCNEWPGNLWAPFFENDPPDAGWSAWNTKASMDYMRRAVECIREAFPEIPLCFSMDNITMEHYKQNQLDFFDLIEHHIWMAKLNGNEFYNLVGNAKNGRFSDEPYHLLVKNAYDVYQKRPEYWKELLRQGIRDLAQVSMEQGLPLATTECWGIVDYKDFPMLRWDWIQDLCQLGLETALDTGRWVMAATSNFAAPQFVGMWRDVQWHQKLTSRMKETVLDENLVNSRLKKRLLLP